MISAGFKKYGVENGFTVEKGVAYGEIGGYTMTFSDGAGSKVINTAVIFPDEGSWNDFMSRLDGVKRQYRVLSAELSHGFLTIAFTDTIGTMKVIRRFVEEWLAPNLRQLGVRGEGHCVMCKGAIASGGSYVKTRRGAAQFHDSCIERAREEGAERSLERRMESKNIGMGALGAFIGGIVGTIPWIIAYYFGWFVGWLGFLIGFAAGKGYQLFGGRPSRAKAPIVVLVVIFCVFFSIFAGTAVEGFVMVAKGETYLSYSEVLPMTVLILKDREVQLSLLPDIGLGILFAGLGCWSHIGQFNREAKEHEAGGESYEPLSRRAKAGQGD